jgi:hypothetical protein
MAGQCINGVSARSSAMPTDGGEARVLSRGSRVVRGGVAPMKHALMGWMTRSGCEPFGRRAAWRASMAGIPATTAAPITSTPWCARTSAQEGCYAREFRMEKTVFPSPTCGQGCQSPGERCHLRRMFQKRRATRVRVARPHCWSSWYIPITDPSAVRTPPQNGSATAPRSILR